jgi:hypothetical protein
MAGRFCSDQDSTNPSFVDLLLTPSASFPHLILCLPFHADFNDVYRVHQKYVASPSPHPSAESSQKQDDDGSHPAGKKQQETISAAQFAQTLLSLREEWEDGKRKGEKEGLVLFSGGQYLWLEWEEGRIKASCGSFRRGLLLRDRHRA